MLELRPFQKTALAQLERYHHILCIAPTGSGKSLIYERFTLENKIRTILITPLIALGRQQADRLSRADIPVFGFRDDDDWESFTAAKTGTWILSPETLHFSTTQERLRKWKPQLLVVDECHCLWDWGDGFRPAFLKIPELLKEHSIPRSLWLTATLPTEARKALNTSLPFRLTPVGEFDLPPRLSLHIRKVSPASRIDRLFEILEQVKFLKNAGVIFVPTRMESARISRLLEAAGVRTYTYHAGLSREERRNIELQVEQHKVDVLVATSAYGMGMDHAHLRWALLWQPPASLLTLTQMIGRAGRAQDQDGTAYLFWSPDDFRSMDWLVRGSPQRRKELTDCREFLESRACRRQTLRSYFGETPTSEGCGKCDQCLLNLQNFRYLPISQA